MASASPFEDAPAAADRPPPSRTRRPWWNGNLITLMVVLFCLAWIRELAGFSVRTTWLAVGLAIAAWLLVPLLTPGRLDQAMGHAVAGGRAALLAARRTGWKSVLLKLVALLTMAVGLLNVGLTVYAMAADTRLLTFGNASQGFNFTRYLAHDVAQSLLVCSAGGVLFVLTDIAAAVLTITGIDTEPTKDQREG